MVPFTSGCEPLTADDIAEVIVFTASRRENLVIADTLVYPNHQVRMECSQGCTWIKAADICFACVCRRRLSSCIAKALERTQRGPRYRAYRLEYYGKFFLFFVLNKLPPSLNTYVTMAAGNQPPLPWPWTKDRTSMSPVSPRQTNVREFLLPLTRQP